MSATSTGKTKPLFVLLDISDSAIFVIGIDDDWDKGTGHLMRSIWDFGDSYRDPGDVFDISAPYDLEGHDGTPSYGITVTYKASSWDEEQKEYYYLIDMQYPPEVIRRWAEV